MEKTDEQLILECQEGNQGALQILFFRYKSLIFNFALRMTLFLFWLQLAGTFLVLVLRPDIAFQSGNPFFLTTEGEFVIKNLVLISAGLVVGSTVQSKERKQ